MKIYFLFLCLIFQGLYSSELLLRDLFLAAQASSSDFNPTKARKIITDLKQNPRIHPRLLLELEINTIPISDIALKNYERAGFCKNQDEKKGAYIAAALGIVTEVAIIAMEGEINYWTIPPITLFAPVVINFCRHQYRVRRAKSLISFMKQTQAELKASQVLYGKADPNGSAF